MGIKRYATTADAAPSDSTYPAALHDLADNSRAQLLQVAFRVGHDNATSGHGKATLLRQQRFQVPDMAVS